jgi:hypothetical protein
VVSKCTDPDGLNALHNALALDHATLAWTSIRQLLTPSTPLRSTHGDQDVLGHANTPRVPSGHAVASRQGTHAVRFLLPAGEYGASTGHTTHLASVPVALLYVPGGHGSPLVEEEPKGQCDPADALHAPLQVLEVNPLDDPNCPGGQ